VDRYERNKIEEKSQHTKRYGFGPHCRTICRIVTEFAMIWTTMPTRMMIRICLSALLKQVYRNQVIPQRENMEAATAGAISVSVLGVKSSERREGERDTKWLRDKVIFHSMDSFFI
jgi:hypothetical protein